MDIRRWASLVAALALTAGCAASSTEDPSATRSGVLRIVAAENVWGSIAAQVGGSRVQVTSIIDNPNADPHDYEPTAADARAVAGADLVLVNGIGYDTWATKLVDANPVPGRIVLDVGTLLGVPVDANPHRWYDPDAVARVVDRLAEDLATAAPSQAAAFQAQKAAFEKTDLARYHQLIADIRRSYAGTPIGASESIVAVLAPALGLTLVTPPAFLRATSEGTEPTAADKATVDRQIADKQIKVLVDNPQNATPDVQRQIEAARAAGIPVTSMTETMVPATATWQSWQTRQLESLRDALAKATRR